MVDSTEVGTMPFEDADHTIRFENNYVQSKMNHKYSSKGKMSEICFEGYLQNQASIEFFSTD